jgi:hypothetical protein
MQIAWHEADCSYEERWRAALTAALPHLAAGCAEAVAVKPLEWREEVAGMWWTAENYRIEACDGGGFAARVTAPSSRNFHTLVFGVSFEAAKAAAQADFEQRIRSALVSAPAAPSDGMGQFKPCIAVNSEAGTIEATFEDVPYVAEPVLPGVYHWIDKHVALDDGRLVGITTLKSFRFL